MNFTSRFLIGVAFIATSAISAQADIERVVERTIVTRPGGTWQVSTQGGSIRVEISNESVVKVTAREHIHADSESEAEALLANLTLTIEKTDDGGSAVAKYANQPEGFRSGSWPPVQVDFLVVVPARYNVDLKTSGGGIAVGDLNGTVNGRTAGGGIKLGRISGEVDVATSGGGIRLAEGGARVHLQTAGGSIFVGHAAGPTDLRTSGGGIQVEAAENTLTARANGGNVRASFVGRLKGDCALSTSGGQIKVSVPAGIGFDLEASTSGGEVETRGLGVTPQSGVIRRGNLAGTVGAGGPLLRLRASGGNVMIEASDAKSS